MKKLFLIPIYLIVSVLMGIFWYYLVVPYIYYITAADESMKDRMQGDLIEFYGIARETVLPAKENIPYTLSETVAILLGKVGSYGIWIWLLISISLSIWSIHRYIQSKHQHAISKPPI
ncbi:hypothetical protein JT359_09165 [Candidatus Poribacteria bacterium]|nr:hypothetical protein [Candidatus Poribacteria bacterium]